MGERRIIRPGENCWRQVRANRAAVLIDGDAYFRAFRNALIHARRSVLILAWDIHSQVRLLRGGEDDGYPWELSEFVRAVLERRPELNIHILCWDFSLIYAMEREWMTRHRLNPAGEDRVHFQLDSKHPIGASHHQKVVVIDDRVAFSGGFDLSIWRWDRTEHQADDPDRVDPDGESYPPLHDIQMVMDGEAARALGELVRDRWKVATGETLDPPHLSGSDAAEDSWPEGAEPEWRDVDLAISRTLPSFEDRAAIREVERLYLDSIREAQRFIYLENQYFSSARVGEALADSLGKGSGPEVVVVLPQQTGGWLEQNTMDVLRTGLIESLREADKHGRLHIYYPVADDRRATPIYVHSKLAIVDDRFLRVGSANLSNRSMGLDSECDIAIEAVKDADREAIRNLRVRLLGEHLGLSKERDLERLESPESLTAAVEGLCRRRGRSLRPLRAEFDSDLERYMARTEWLDPEQPVDPEQLVRRVVPEPERPQVLRRVLLTTAIVVVVAFIVGLIEWGLDSDEVDAEAIADVLERFRHYELAPLIVILFIAVVSGLGVPINLLVVGAVLAFGPGKGFGYSFVGAGLSALAGFALGHAVGRRWIDKMAGGRLTRINERIARRGTLAVAVVRVLPVAPFAVINLAAGASLIRFRQYVQGTLLGLTPGMLAVVLFTDRLHAVIRDPNPRTILTLILVGGGVLTGLFGIQKWLGRRKARLDDAPGGGS